MKPEEGYIVYNVELTQLAKQNRKNYTKAEGKMWYEVLQGRKTGFKFLRQKPILNFILDFYCSKLLLAIEVDGDSHAEREGYDQKRTDTTSLLIYSLCDEAIFYSLRGINSFKSYVAFVLF